MSSYTRIVTASSYVLVGGLFVFQVGPAKAGNRLGVVRLGGHMEAGETSLDCVRREVREEASLRITPLQPPATYLVHHGTTETNLQPTAWTSDDLVAPLVVYRRPESAGAEYSLTYLSKSDDVPAPAAESQGLLLLSPADVLRVTSRPLTLRQFLETGGRAVLRHSLPLDFPLEPYSQLRLLPRLLELHPTLAAQTSA